MREQKSYKMHPWLRRAIWVSLILLIGYLMFPWLIRKMIYPAPFFTVGAPPAQIEEVPLKLADGTEVFAWLKHSNHTANDSTPVLLFFHGNGENLKTMQMGGMFEAFTDLGVHFLALDYPGYGKSEGNASEESILAAANELFTWANEAFPKAPKIIGGWSLGAGVAFQNAAAHSSDIDGLLVISPWSSLPDVAAAHYPRWMVNSLLKEQYDSRKAAEKITCPALVIHGERDGIIPFSQGKLVKNYLAGKVSWLPVANAGHNDIFQRQVVWEAIGTFLKNFSAAE